ncbi:hypothetical protein ACHAWT_006986 [Skeletonema menzelii]|mmetsp:Transcript_13000/g.21301  ORF Transcript_13000/g.21301 Transcript_13000/m.21301 type:complete len:610 (-) Transcript_13000:81-1910(-)
MFKKAHPQDKDDEASVDSSVASLDKDLQALNEMDIDADFNMWSSFRGSFSIEKRASLEQIGNSMRSSASGGSTSALLQGTKNEKFNDSLVSINEIEVQEDPLQKLSPAEQKDIHQWNVRLGREQVFSRYYFPERWELNELNNIQKFLKLEKPNMDEPGEEATKRAISSIFFPDDYDKKSVLMKRGPILLDGIDERELFLFTHGFLLSRIEFDSLMNLLLTMKSGNPEQFTSAELKKRFDDIDSDHSGEIDRCELREIFVGMGVPVGERALSEIMRKIDTDEDGTITFDEFEHAMQELAPTPKEEKTLFGSLGKRITKYLSSSDMQRKLECAYMLADVEKIECLSMYHSAKTRMFAESSFGDLSFAIHVKDQEQPLVLICSKPEHRDAWINAFKICMINSVQNATDKSAKQMRAEIGWQHKIVRATIFSLVVLNNLDGLHIQITSDSRKICLNERDDYHGFTALHYAAALGRLDCAILLLQAKVDVNMKCNEQKTPLDYAISYEEKDMIKLLEQYGAKANRSGVLFESAIEEQKRLKKRTPKTANRKTILRAEGATGAMSEAMNALKERGDRIEKLDKKTADLQSDAQNYAEMAKKLKEKSKKKSTFFGL